MARSKSTRESKTCKYTTGHVCDIPEEEQRCKECIIYARVHQIDWKDVPFEDKVDMAGGGRAGYEARKRHGYPDRERACVETLTYEQAARIHKKLRW